MNHTETDCLFATEPYRYAADIANIIAPTCDNNDYGFPDEYSTTGMDAFYCLQKDGFDFLFTKEEFFENQEIQEELNKRQVVLQQSLRQQKRTPHLEKNILMT